MNEDKEAFNLDWLMELKQGEQFSGGKLEIKVDPASNPASKGKGKDIEIEIKSNPAS